MSVSQKLTVTEVEGSASIEGNTSQVNILWTSTQTGESLNVYTRTAYYYVTTNDGEETQYAVSYNLPQNKTKTIVNKTITVPHNDDGTGTVTVRTWMDTRISAGVVQKSQTITLATIPRASTLDSLSCSNNYFTGALAYKYTPKSNAFYNRCEVSLSINEEQTVFKTIDLGAMDTTQQTDTIALTDDELAIIYNALPNEAEGVLRVTLRTYSDADYSNQIGDEECKEVTLAIPNNAATQPGIEMVLSPVGSLPESFAGLYVQGKTKVKATIAVAGKYGAEITDSGMKVADVIYGADDDYTSEYLSNYGSQTVNGYAIDSRGYTGNVSEVITVIAYSKPKVSVSVCGRCDAEGNLSDSGTYLKIKASRSYSPVKSGDTQHNFCKIQYRYKAASASSYSAWTTILDGSNLSTNEVETAALLGGVLAVDTTYQVQVRAVDDIGEYADTMFNVPTDIVHNHKTKNGWGFGKYCEGENLLDCAWDAHFHGEVLIGESGTTLKDYILAVISEGG